jgi:hypothetical protein
MGTNDEEISLKCETACIETHVKTPPLEDGNESQVIP